MTSQACPCVRIPKRLSNPCKRKPSANKDNKDNKLTVPSIKMAIEGIKAVDAQMSVLLHPSRAGNVLLGAQEILNSLLLRFNGQFDGVILAYLAPKIITQNAKILTGLTPYFHVSIMVKLIIFSPAAGMKIEGKVIKIEKDYIGVLVLGLFNTTIGGIDIREDLDYIVTNAGKRAWVSCSDDQHRIELGSLIRFSVKSLQEAENFIDICGSLEANDTGCVKWLERAFVRSKADAREAYPSTLSKSSEREHKSKRKRKKADSQELITPGQVAKLITPVGSGDLVEFNTLKSAERSSSKKRRRHDKQS